MATKIYGATSLGSGTGGLANLGDLDQAHVATLTDFYIYSLDDDSAAAESSPDVISPTANAGTKRWILVKKYANDTVVLLTGTQTLTNKILTAPTLTSPVLNTAVSGTAVLDEDNMASDSNTQIATQQSIKAFIESFTKGYTQRAKFTYNGGATAYTIKISAAAYFCKDKIAQWTSQLTTTAIGTPAADDWYYLYLDYSGITSGTAITNSELLWSQTEPAWSETWKQWMNGDDRCIFAVRTNAGPTNIDEFFQDGDFVLYADHVADLAALDIKNDWTDEITLRVPAFVRKAKVAFQYKYIDETEKSAFWRTEGQAGTIGHLIGTLSATATANYVDLETDVICSANLKIDVSDNTPTATNTLSEVTHGFYLPVGM
jgi:hypothetical protein